MTGRPAGYDFQSFLGEFTSFAMGLPGPLAGPATDAQGGRAKGFAGRRLDRNVTLYLHG